MTTAPHPILDAPTVDPTPRPTDSPWGEVHTARQIRPGVWTVTTAGHGGVQVAKALNFLIPERLRWPDGWYEEDAEWVLPWVYLKLPAEPHWPAGKDILDNLRDAYPEAYEALLGVTLVPGESRRRDEDAWQAAHAADLQVVTAYGDWKAGVPKGQVGVVALRGGRTATTADRARPEFFLVNKEDYHAAQQRSPFGTLVTAEFTPADTNFRKP